MAGSLHPRQQISWDDLHRRNFRFAQADLGTPLRHQIKIPGEIFHLSLVYVETFDDMETAIMREKQLKRWHRPWKLNLIEADNPRWIDLAIDMGFERLPEMRRAQPKPSP